MVESDDFRVTNRDVYNTLLQFRKEFSDYVTEQGPKMVLLQYKVEELETKIKRNEEAAAATHERMEQWAHNSKENRKLVVGSFLGSGVFLEVLNWILFHK